MGNAVIYRPAYDAEVEYLESTGTQWIDTDALSEEGIVITSKFKYNYIPPAGSSPRIFMTHPIKINDTVRYGSVVIFASSAGKWISRMSSNLKSDVPSDTDIHTIIYNTVDNVVLLDGEILFNCSATPILMSESPIMLFGGTNTPAYDFLRGRIYSLSIQINGILVRDFIPVRIGQIGYLYDKVSKQLFANKGTGQFILGNDVSNAVIPQQRCVLYFGGQRSVVFERIYEEYEWIGTESGSPRITLQEGYNTDENAFIETTYKCQYQNPNVDMIIGFGITGSNAGIRVFNASSSVVIIDVHRRTNGTHTAKRIYGRNGQIGVPRYLYVSLTEYRVDNISGSITLNEDFDKNIGVGASSIYTNDYSNDVWYKETKLRANNITYDLIPCKLLQPIPAILDGNGIARQAGECGMWDKVSNRFYGNVASSGSFTVSND